MKKLSKLHCFRCGHRFQWVHHYTHEIRNEPIWRWDNEPLCKDCMRDSLDTLYFNDDLIQWFMDSMDTEKYQRNYNKFIVDVMTVDCPNPKCRCNIYLWKYEKNHNGQTYAEIGSEMSCPECHWFFAFDKNGKIETYAVSEDAYIEYNQKYKDPIKPNPET